MSDLGIKPCPRCGFRTCEYDAERSCWQCNRFRCSYFVFQPKQTEKPPSDTIEAGTSHD